MNSYNRQGMTLAELLIASAIVGFVILGILAVELAIRNSRDSSKSESVLAMQTQAIMLRISSDATQAVGNSSDPGIITSVLSNPVLCIRQDTDNDPNTFTGDKWVCYWQNGYNIHYCKDKSTPSICLSSDEIVGTANAFTYTFTMDLVAKQIYLDFTLTARAKPGMAMHPISNPEYTITTHVTPAGHGF